MNLFVLIIGSVFFAATGLWWIAPLTILTYAAVVTLAARDPLFQHHVLEGRSSRTLSNPTPADDVSPERRARWLPRGETRRKVEESLEVYRKAVQAIEESDEITRTVLEDATPRLHAAAERLVDLAQDREKAAQVLNELPEDIEENESRRDLQNKIHAADTEISGVIEKFVALRTRVVRISLDSGPAAQAMAGELNSSLDELNYRLEALGETMSGSGE